MDTVSSLTVSLQSSAPGCEVGNDSWLLSYFCTDPELLGVGSLLKKYIALLCTHIGDILPVATSIASTGCRHFAEVSRVIEGDLTGKPFHHVLYLLPEFDVYLFMERVRKLQMEVMLFPL